MRNFVISFLMSKFSTCKLFVWPKIDFFASQNFIGKMAFMTEHKLKSEEVGRGPRAHT